MKRRVVIAGAGLAAVRAAEALRRKGFDGSVVIVGDEPHLPYDRPPLSKQILVGKSSPADVIFREREYFEDLDVELLTGSPIVGLDVTGRTIRLGSGQMPYDELIVCTGSRPRDSGWTEPLEGVVQLRTIDDSIAIRDRFEMSPRVVVAGAGFIGAEVASSARALGLDVTLVELQPTPMARSVGPWVAPAFVSLHRDNGTDLRCGVKITEILGRDHVEGVRLSDGTELPCDLLVAGLGVVPNVEWLAGSGLSIDDGLVCDRWMCAGPPTVHAAGDVARWPNGLTGRMTRGQQWMVAVEQARHVASRIVDPSATAPFTSSSYFWSHQYDQHFQFAGSARANEVRVLAGALDEEAFLVAYSDADRLVGVLTKNMSAMFVKAKPMLESGSPWSAVLSLLN